MTQSWTDNRAAGNKVLPKAGLNGFDWAFVQSSTFVFLLNFSAKFPRLRQYPNRCKQTLSVAFNKAEKYNGNENIKPPIVTKAQPAK